MKSSLKYLFFIFLVTYILYSPSLFGFYTNDDFFHLSISRAKTIQDFFNFFNLVKGPEGLGIYRPLTTQVFYFMGWKLFNLNPLGLHIISFLFFFLVIYLVYKFTMELTKKENVGLISAFLYATSATHFGHFYYLATFQEVGLAAAFLFSAIYFIKFLEDKNLKLYFLSLIGFILAVLSKENAVVLPFVFILIYFFLRLQKRVDASGKILSISLVPWVLFLAGYSYMRFFHYGFVTGDSYIWDFSARRTLNTLGWYTLWSFNLPEMLVDFVGPGLKFNPNLFKFWSREVIPILVLFVTEVAMLFYLVIKSKILNLKSIFLFFLAWFVLTLSPVLFLPLHKFAFYLTVPLVGFVVLLAYILVNHKSKILNLLFLSVWISSSIVTLTLTSKTNWITKGQETARSVHNYLLENTSTLEEYKTIAFYDTEEDKELPWSPTEVLRVTLSDQNYFKVFWDDKMTAGYYNSEEEAKEEIKIKARQFLGY